MTEAKQKPACLRFGAGRAAELKRSAAQAAMKKKEQLLGYIFQYLSDDISLADFSKAYNFCWGDMDENELQRQDREFFSEINDHLHHTDWYSPADSALTEPTDFKNWLRNKIGTYSKGE